MRLLVHSSTRPLASFCSKKSFRQSFMVFLKVLQCRRPFWKTLGVPSRIPPSFLRTLPFYILLVDVKWCPPWWDAGLSYEAKFEQRRFSSRSLQGGSFEVEEENSSENALSMEVEAAKEVLKTVEMQVWHWQWDWWTYMLNRIPGK